MNGQDNIFGPRVEQVWHRPSSKVSEDQQITFARQSLVRHAQHTTHATHATLHGACDMHTRTHASLGGTSADRDIGPGGLSQSGELGEEEEELNDRMETKFHVFAEMGTLRTPCVCIVACV
jgi:hypothetical protein